MGVKRLQMASNRIIHYLTRINMREDYLQAIEIPADLDADVFLEIFNLKCVKGAWKDDYGIIKYEVQLSDGICNAEAGDILVQLPDKSWTLCDEEEFAQRFE